MYSLMGEISGGGVGYDPPGPDLQGKGHSSEQNGRTLVELHNLYIYRERFHICSGFLYV